MVEGGASTIKVSSFFIKGRAHSSLVLKGDRDYPWKIFVFGQSIFTLNFLFNQIKPRFKLSSANIFHKVHVWSTIKHKFRWYLKRLFPNIKLPWHFQHKRNPCSMLPSANVGSIAQHLTNCIENEKQNHKLYTNKENWRRPCKHIPTEASINPTHFVFLMSMVSPKPLSKLNSPGASR